MKMSFLFVVESLIGRDLPLYNFQIVYDIQHLIDGKDA